MKGVILASAFITWMSAALATGDEGDATLDRVLARIASEAGNSVRFREEKTLSFLDSPLVTYGRLRLEAPDKLIRETAGQSGARFVVSSSTLVIEEAGKAPKEMRLDDYPALRGMMDTMRALFTGDLSILNRLYRIKLQTDGAAWAMELRPREDAISRFVTAIKVSGREARIRTIETLESGGDRVLMTILQDG